MIWLLPAALWGLAALAVPILVHLLTRQERRSIAFPSLRFLTETRLVALRHRRIHDWPLLLVRAAILAIAVAALGGPLLITSQRERAWQARVARAVVVADADRDGVQGAGAGSADVPSDEIANAFASRVIAATPRLADALRTAVEWLSTQPPAAREIVIAGDLRIGALDEADLAVVPAHVGIRFLPDATSTPESVIDLPVLTQQREGRVVVDERRVQLHPRETIVEAAPRRVVAARGARSSGEAGARPDASGASRHRLEVRATASDQPVADAALAALLTEGIVADAGDTRHVIVLWPGVEEPSSSRPPSLQASRPMGPRPSPWMRAALERLDMDGDIAEDALIVRLPGPVAGADAVATLRRIASAAFDDPLLPREPERIAAANLARWSRPSGVAPDAGRQEEGDRRVLWALALALLGVETLMRRTKTPTSTAEAPVEESRVA